MSRVVSPLPGESDHTPRLRLEVWWDSPVKGDVALISTWLWILSVLSVSYGSSIQFIQCDHPIWNSVHARDGGRSGCILIEPPSDHNNNSGGQQAKYYIAGFHPTHRGLRSWEIAFKQIRTCAEYHVPGQDSEKPAMDLTACVCIRHML